MADTNIPAIIAILKGREVLRTIIDGGSGINVISQRTCDTLRIQEWEPCPFWLRMANISSENYVGPEKPWNGKWQYLNE